VTQGREGSSVDLLVVGGGINGVGIARDAAGRGLRVLLCEKSDLASATSSASTKLIHGGLRYLEHYEFRLVREALTEREVLLGLAPHIAWPMRFIMPHAPELPPAWMIRAGLFLYDHLGGRKKLPASRSVDFGQDIAGRPLRPEFTRGFSYADCWVDDARLVVLNAVDARNRGVEIFTRAPLIAAQRDGQIWRAMIQTSGGPYEVHARAIVNAAGPWVGPVLGEQLKIRSRGRVKLVRGSHIVVPQLYEGKHAYILQHTDRRIVFAIPYEQRFTLIGTTDVEVTGRPEESAITRQEIEYLCAAVSRYFFRPVSPADVIWTYSGVRPLYDDGTTDPSAVTRDYVFELDGAPGGNQPPPVLSIFGGKITTYRRLAEEALDELRPFFPKMGRAWTHGAPLPGGDIPNGDFDALVEGLARQFPGIDRNWLARIARRHGTRAAALVGDAKRMADLGQDFGGGLYAREVDWLRREEWAVTAEDILWRRTKLGLHVPKEAAARLAAYLGHAETARA
jgi:glycerol-3-phosphate dehydrogenase